MNRARFRRPAVTLFETLVATVCLLTLAALATPRLVQMRETSRLDQCMD